MPGPLNSLADVRVLDLSDDIAGAYCAKLLADAGAEVVKVEPSTGHPLRSWSRSGSVGSDGETDGVLFRYLAAGQRSVIADCDAIADLARIRQLMSASDIVIAGRLEVAELHAANPAATVVAITPFGLQGPRASGRANDILLQALSGALYDHGTIDRTPLAVGGGVPRWIPGVYAAAGALAARARTERTGRGELVDVSSLECLALTLVCYPSVSASLPGGARRRNVHRLIPGIEPCRDGLVGFTTLTAQQWHDFLAMIGRDDLIDSHEFDDQRVRIARSDEILPIIHAWTTKRASAEIVALAADFRVPASPLLNGATLSGLDHLAARGLFDNNPRGGFPHPRSPFRSSTTGPKTPERAPHLGEHQDFAPVPRASSPRTSDVGDRLPLQGVRVLDCTAFWAGPYATQYLATLGADVIKVESIQRPDLIRFAASAGPTVERWYEQGFLYLSANLNKRGITLNLADAHGRELFLALVAQSDVVVENYSPRVMDNFRLTYGDLRAVREDIVYVRMPGWGLEGPWREWPAFATTMEQASGMAWLTGYQDGDPIAPGLCDPLAGIHAAFAALAALEERRVTGRGQQVEVSMIDMAVNVAAEQILEYAAYGHLMTREGNRAPDAVPQGVYPCAEAETWVALSISGDGEWQALKTALDNPSWADEPALATVHGRHAAHARLDRELTAWCAGRSLGAVLAELRAVGVLAEPVVHSYAIDTDEQMCSRGFWEAVTHPVAGTHSYPGWPMLISGSPRQWYRSAAPVLGQHTEEVLTKELGLNQDQLAELRAAKIIGDRPLGL